MLKSKKTNYYFFSALLVVFFFLSTRQAIALEINLPGLSQNPSIVEYVIYLFKFGISVGVVLALISFTVGAVSLINPDPGAHGEAKERMRGAVLGLLLLASSFVIMNTINPKFKTPTLTALPIVTLTTTPPQDHYYVCGDDTIRLAASSETCVPTFYSAPFGWDVGARAGYSGNIDARFSWVGVDRPEAYKTKCATFKDCPGSIKVVGPCMIILHSGQDCHAFYQKIPNMKAQAYVASDDTPKTINIIPVE